MTLWGSKCGSALVRGVFPVVTALGTKGLYQFVYALRALSLFVPVLCAALAVGACSISHVQCEKGDVGFVPPPEWVLC